MGKVIAVYGSPFAGKTTFGIKLAQQIYLSDKDKSVIFLSADMRIPTLSILFPHRENADIFSLGEAMDRAEITADILTEQLVTVKAMPNLGYIGYKSGENRYTYPRLTEDKAADLFACLRQLANTVGKRKN